MSDYVKHPLAIFNDGKNTTPDDDFENEAEPSDIWNYVFNVLISILVKCTLISNMSLF